ncbi:MAG TPA: hypothetical protein VIL26_01235 [Clostridia bacterium]
MKKLSLLLLALFIMTMSFSMVACGEKKTPADPDAALKQDVLLCDFEQWAPDFQTIKFMNGFGRVSKNEDKQYVKSGNYSARLDPLGWYGAGSLPLIFFPTRSETFGFDYSDFSYVDYISVDIYSANNKDMKINMGLVSDIANINSISRINDKEITLKPGWNKINFQVDASLIAITGDITSVKGIYFMFENAASLNPTETTPRYYVDDIKIIKKQEKSPSDFNFVLDENEIMDFEKNYQQYCITSEYPAEISVVNASDYGLVAPSGKKVLRVNYLGTGTNYWRYFKIDKKLIQATVIKGMSLDNAQKAYLCLEVYNNDSDTKRDSIHTTVDYTVGDNTNNRHSTALFAKRGQWTSYEYCLGNVAKFNENFFNDPGALMIWYTDLTGNREFFYDNIRIEFRN